MHSTGSWGSHRQQAHRTRIREIIWLALRSPGPRQTVNGDATS